MAAIMAVANGMGRSDVTVTMAGFRQDRER